MYAVKLRFADCLHFPSNLAPPSDHPVGLDQHPGNRFLDHGIVDSDELAGVAQKLIAYTVSAKSPSPLPQYENPPLGARYDKSRS